MIQTILVGVIFIGAVFYLGRLFFRNFQSKSDCASGCGKCSAVDFRKLEAQLKKKGL